MDAIPSDGANILVIDDEPVVVDVLRTVLANRGYRIEAAQDAAAGRRLIESDTDWRAKKNVGCAFFIRSTIII